MNVCSCYSQPGILVLQNLAFYLQLSKHISRGICYNLCQGWIQTIKYYYIAGISEARIQPNQTDTADKIWCCNSCEVFAALWNAWVQHGPEISMMFLLQKRTTSVPQNSVLHCTDLVLHPNPILIRNCPPETTQCFAAFK